MHLRIFALAFVLLLTGCGTTGWARLQPLQCVPYARDVSGIEIYGDAHTWWDKAGKHPQYARGKMPVKGSVLVLSKTGRLQYGHVAVVERVLNKREIEVTHVNWGQDQWDRRKVYRGMLVQDVSRNNDWSQLQFWSPEADSFGRTYQASGFVYEKRDALALN